MKRILVAEDSGATQKFIAYTLRSRGYEVDTCADGLDALTRYASETYDGVVLDIMMPRMNGLDVLAEIRSQYPDRKTPIILLTSETRPDDQKRGLELGADSFVAKPFKPEQLLEVVEKLAGKA
ncbi:MAG: response regulator [Deltaproteobacteria bacterium]|nr:response regulator [Deltaproteobacteria bacterium]